MYGGAGGLGEVWTRHMVSRYDADVVWIGRRAPDAEIEAKLDAVAALGRRPRYFAADASDETALADAVQRIHAIFPRIDGVVHSALVLQDKSVRGMDETVFRQGLAAKVDLSVNLEKVFRDCDLDFMLFLTSLSWYSRGAGCTFKDSFANAVRSVCLY
ncbi:MAG: SDR family NAD(P)-dependent oxidoreductase, partial [Lysobacter sp.]|nr:SDR family NAD(P)-dependent oxidoreductase [Lysobacter sp.]